MNYTNVDIKNFIENIITHDNIDNILDTCKTQSEKGFIFERLWDVIIKFGFCEKFSNSNFNHLVGNSNNGKLKILKNLDKYLNEKVISGKSSGCSDITLQNKNDDTFIFISSKYPKSPEDIKKQKSFDYYDIQNIITVINNNKLIYKNYKIYLIVPNKKKVLDKVKTANISSEYITEHMREDNILDKDNLNKYFLLFKQDIIKNKTCNEKIMHPFSEIYLIKKDNLKSRFHQELITKIIKDKNSLIYINFKLSLQSLIDKPKELFEIINECLKPKISEKKEFGEVFTPMDFINNKILKDLEAYWMEKYNENIYTNKNITWYDPAAGMGNFPIAIYYNLMNGLKEIIPDEKERKKHILEKQLFIGELNKKNCFVITQIFNIGNEYKLNLYCGNTLEINLNEIFGINKFDIIIGNPPYNENLTSVGAKPLYNKFIEYYVTKCKLLSFIVPSRWFAGGYHYRH